MASYVVRARIVGAEPHRARRSPARDPGGTSVARADHGGGDVDQEVLDVVGRPFGQVIGERWGRAREIWSQTTFYLFDPDSWR